MSSIFASGPVASVTSSPPSFVPIAYSLATIATPSYSSIVYATSVPQPFEAQWGLTTKQVTWLCQSINAGVYIGAMAWGLHTAIFYKAVRTVLKSNDRSRRIWLPFVSVLWAMGSINMACNIKVNELAFIDSITANGGALAYDTNVQRYPVTLAALAVGIINLTLADSFLIYRIYSVWKQLYITIPLGMLCAVSSGFAIFQCSSAADNFDSYWTGPSSYFSGAQVYGGIMGSLHTLFAIILLWRILDLRRKLSGGLTAHNKAKYAGIKTIVIESALPYGIISFVLMILYCAQSSGANLFVPLLVQLEGIVPELIITRIMSDYAWSLDKFLAINKKMAASHVESGYSMSVPDTEGVSMATLVTESHGSMDKKVPPAYVA